MKVSLFRDKSYEFTWPTEAPAEDSGFAEIPETERIVIVLRRLGHNQKRKIEDGMMSIATSDMQRTKGRKAASKSKDMKIEYKIGSVKETQLKESVVSWKNLIDESTGKPIPYSWDAFTELLDCNGGLPTEHYGHFETELLDYIQEYNGFEMGTSPGN